MRFSGKYLYLMFVIVVMLAFVMYASQCHYDIDKWQFAIDNDGNIMINSMDGKLWLVPFYDVNIVDEQIEGYRLIVR